MLINAAFAVHPFRSKQLQTSQVLETVSVLVRLVLTLHMKNNGKNVIFLNFYSSFFLFRYSF